MHRHVRCARALRRMHMPTCVRVLGGGSFLDLALDEVAAAVARPPPVECDGGRGLAVRGRLVRSLAAVVRGEAQQFRAWCRVTRGAAEVRKQVGRPFRAPLPFPLLSPLPAAFSPHALHLTHWFGLQERLALQRRAEEEAAELVKKQAEAAKAQAIMRRLAHHPAEAVDRASREQIRRGIMRLRESGSGFSDLLR